MSSILVCGFPASGKTTVAKIVANALSFEMIGGTDILRELAKEHGYKPVGNDWWDTPEGIKFLRERASDPQFDIEVDKRLIEKVKKGNVIATSYTLPWLIDFGFKVWLQADVETRAKRMAQRDNISVEEAKKVLSIRDNENKELYAKLYGIRFGDDLSPFHIVIDVNKISAEEAAEKIIKEFRNKSK
ncbi:MAG: cytidylate kinase family protein [Candidatus Micrarchaeia archaeon]